MRILWVVSLILFFLLGNVYALELLTTVQVAQNPSGSYSCYQKNNIYPSSGFLGAPVYLFSSSYSTFPTIQERSFSGGFADVTFSSVDPNYAGLVNYFGTNSPRIFDFCGNNDELFKVECGNYWNYANYGISQSIGGLVKVNLGDVVSNPGEWRCENWISVLNRSVVKQPGFFAPKVDNVIPAGPGNPGPFLGASFYSCYLPNCIFNVTAEAQQGRIIDRIIVQGPAPVNTIQNISYCGLGNRCDVLFNVPFSSYGGPHNNTYFFTAVDNLNVSGVISVSV
tara:strand:+ start:554 stop:1396 length:843 start_codon:yes stop_codon:yes gene_type:complete